MNDIDITDDTFVSHVYGEDTEAIEPDEIILDEKKSERVSDRYRQEEWLR